MTTKHPLLEPMDFGVQQFFSDRLIRAKVRSEVARDAAMRGWEVMYRTTMLGGQVRTERDWTPDEYRPLWARILRRITPPFLRPVTIRHYHTCPHLEVPDSTHIEWLTTDDTGCGL